jgi:uncharacterized protein (DUF1499 family)
MKPILTGLLALAVLAGLGLMVYVRLAPLNAERWHADPATVPDPATPNFARADRVVPLAPAVALARIEAIARSEGAGELARGGEVITFVQRSRLMGYPDFINLRITAEGAGARVVALSRSRFGSGDMGVNAARLTRWMTALD